MADHLLLMNLGPIQDFIAAARRCQDLWFGSWLLSDLSRAAAAGLALKAGPHSLVFPSAPGNDKASVANKILLLVPDGVLVADVAEAGRAALVARRDEIVADAYKRLPPGGDFLRGTAEKQVQDLIEVMWVSVPIVSTYKEARVRVESLLSARKSWHAWSAVPWQEREGIPKCSVCGQRESVLHERVYAKGEKAAHRRNRFRVRGMERLCGVCLLKRVGEELDVDESVGVGKPPFHSTSHISAVPLLARMHRGKNAADEALAKYLTCLKDATVELVHFSIKPGHFHGDSTNASIKNPIEISQEEHPAMVPRVFRLDPKIMRGYDGYLLYEDRLREILSEDASNAPPEAEEGARKQLHTFFDALGTPAPCAYYALLIADGDHMGRAIDDLGDVESHRALSAALEAFARKSIGLIERHGGSPIYAGGDDVMALLPLHSALACADDLRTKFVEALRPICEGRVKELPTLSIGLGVAHHMADLADARKLAKAAEGLAKVTRNALGIAVQKRSGGMIQCAGRWDEATSLRVRIDGWCQLFARGELPQGLAYDLESEVATFEVGRAAHSPEENKELQRVVLSLARRMVKRKRGQGGESAVSEAVVTALKARFVESEDPIVAVRSLSDELQIARVFLGAYEVAFGPWPEPATNAPGPEVQP